MEPETMAPDPKPGRKPGDPSDSASEVWGSRPVLVSETDATALPPRRASDTATGLGSGMGGGPAPGGLMSATSVSVSGDVFGQYELLSEVARGGMGVVYKARQRGLDRMVALKMVLGFSGGDHEAALQRFILEARSAASLDHPNVVPIYDSGEIDGKMYFTMALVEGPNLKSYVETNGVPPIPEAVSLFSQIVGGVAHAHQQGIIHRDLKPANVLMDRDGRPRVTDFGLAKRSGGSSELTGTGQVMGTPAYMPPEQARDSKDVGPPADVYSLGAILYFLLTGRPPFVGESVPDLLIKVVSEAPEPPGAINPAVPAELEAVCLRCLEKKPADRYADAKELAGALLSVVEQYVPRSAHSMALISGRQSGMVGLSSVTRAPAAGLTATSMGGAAAEPPRSRTRVVALASACGLLAAVALYLAVIRPPKKVDDKPGPGPIAAATPGAAATPAPTPDEGDSLTWPAVATNDFGLKVDFVGFTPMEVGGILQMPNKTVLKIRLTADRDCNAAVFWIDPTGEFKRLFPNRHDRDGHLTAGALRTIPGAADKSYELETTPTQGGAAERLRVLATTGPMPTLVGDGGDNYEEFKTLAVRKQAETQLRGIRVKSAGAPDAAAPKVAEAELRFHVNP